MKRNLFGFLVLFSCILNFGQVSFSNPSIFINKTYYSDDPNVIISADLDGDSFKEILTTSDNNRSLLIYKNTGGDLQAHQPIVIDNFPINTAIFAVQSGDLDNDGLKDIVICNREESKVYWYKNLGGLKFSERKVIETSLTKPTSIAIGDINNDGNLDIIANSGTFNDPNSLRLIINNGNGNFAKDVVLALSARDITKIKLVDINNNGYSDIVTCEADGNIYFLNNKNGDSWDTPKLVAGSSGGEFEFIDINGDNYLDLVYSENYSKRLSYKLNNKGLDFFIQKAIISDIDITRLSLFDVDKDGLNDFIVSKSVNGNNTIGWIKNNNNLTFSNFMPVLNGLMYPKNILIEDLDKDGKFDVIGTVQIDTNFGRKLASYKYDNITKLYQEKTLSHRSLSISDVRSADVDSDGKNDIIVLYPYAMTISKNLGNNQYSAPIYIKDISNVTINNSVWPFDFDNDGLLDLLIISAYQIELLKNDGNFNFSSVYLNKMSNSPFDLPSIADFNNDGKLDFAIMTKKLTDSNPSFHLFLQTGNLDFVMTKPNLNLSGVFLTADIDKDGSNDLFGKFGGDFVWLKNDGSGSFSSGGTFPNPVGSYNFPFVIGDINNDGYPDIIVGDKYSGSAGNNPFYYFLNNTNGGFNSPKIIDYYTCDRIKLADINNDGYLDLIASVVVDDNVNKKEKILTYLNNNGNGFHDRKEIYEAYKQTYPLRLDIADINNDNKVDIVSTYEDYLTSVHIFFNTSQLSTIDNLQNKLFRLELFPNPSASIVNWAASLDIVQLSIYDMNANLLITKKINESHFDTINLSTGIYYFILKSKSGKDYISKFIKK